jgi:hypothetical protein
MTMYKTIILDQSEWDLVADSNGNIAIAEPPYAVAQDVASAIRTFKGELWYNQTKGVPYFQEILGTLPPPSLFRGYIEDAALSVPGVVAAQCQILDRITTVRSSTPFIGEILDEFGEAIEDELGEAITGSGEVVTSSVGTSSPSGREIIGQLKFIDETGVINGVLL